MPKVMPMPNPPQPPRTNRSNSEAVYAEEALRVAQRHLDQVDEIDRLGREMDEWRRRALMAEAEIKRLLTRENDLTDALERQQEKLMTERDQYRNRLNNMVSQFHTAGAIILACLDKANSETGASPINQTLLAQELEAVEQPSKPEAADPAADDDPLPRIVAAGPREP